MHTEPVTADHSTPKQWGILAATCWAVLAFFLPQVVLAPFADTLQGLPLDHNTRVFLLQGIAELGAVLLLWFILKRVYRAGLRDVGLKHFSLGRISWAVLAFPLYLLVSIAISNIVGRLFSIDLTQTQNIGYTTTPGSLELVLIFAGLVLLAPFVEELLFRGFLFTAFRRTFGFWAGAAIVSLLFALAHGQINVGIDVFVLSMFLCYLREKTDSLWPSIALHMLKNLVAFIILFIIGVK